MNNRLPDLNDLAFTGRNKQYGAYLLRKKYTRYLFISTLLTVLIVSIIILAFFLHFFFEEGRALELNYITDVQYFSMPLPQDDNNKLAGSLPLESTEEEAPQVVDSVTQEKLKPDTYLSTPEEENQALDSAGKNAGNAVTGNGSGDASGIVKVIDVYPRFPGGDEARLWFLRKTVRYPETALKASIQGIVLVVFIIEIDGSVSNVGVDKGIGGGCDEEAVRVVKLMPKWEPARRAGKPVRIVVRIPIIFRLPGK